MLVTDGAKLKQYYKEYRIWQGIPGVEVTKKGRIFCTFYSGSTLEKEGNFCMLTKSEDGECFTEPIAVAYDVGHRCFDPCVWIDPLGRLWFIWAVMEKKGCFGVICDDPDADELSWGEEFFIGYDIMLNKPIVLRNGEWIFPVASWDQKRLGLSPLYYNSVGEPGSYAYVSRDQGKTFQILGASHVPDRWFDEHMILEMKDGSLKMFVRTSYGIGVTESFDGGKTWTEGGNSGLGGPNSRFYIGRLKSGRILLINHVDFSDRERTNLCAMLSEDEGMTWKYRFMLDDRKEVSYPDAKETEDGFIHIVYDRERGAYKKSMDEVYPCAREILYTKITEEDIIAGSLVNEKSKMKTVISKLGEYIGDEPDFTVV